MENKPRNAFIAWVKEKLSDIKRKLTGNAVTEIERIEREFLKVAYAVSDQNAQQQSVSEQTQNVAVNEKTTTDEGSGVSWAIGLDANGNYFADIQEDIFDETDGESVARTIQRVISERFKNLIKVHGQKIQINKTTNDEFRMSESARKLMEDTTSYNDKLKTIANADEIIAVAKNWIGEELNHPRNDDIIEFARGNVNYRVGKNGYAADVIVGIRSNGAAVLYDLVNIYHKKITEAPVTMASKNRSQRRQETSSHSLPETPQNVKEKSANQNDTKQKQLEIIKETNPMWDDYHTGIRTVDDIRTWEEVLELDDEREGQFVWGDFSRDDAEQALKDGTITVYSSYPIENGVFVSTSYIQAEEYAGGRGGKVYSKTIPLIRLTAAHPLSPSKSIMWNEKSLIISVLCGQDLRYRALQNMQSSVKQWRDGTNMTAVMPMLRLKQLLLNLAKS